MEPITIDIREAARLTSLSPHTIRAYIKKGRIPAIRICRRVLIETESLRRLVAEHREERRNAGRENDIHNEANGHKH